MSQITSPKKANSREERALKVQARLGKLNMPHDENGQGDSILNEFMPKISTDISSKQVDQIETMTQVDPVISESITSEKHLSHIHPQSTYRKFGIALYEHDDVILRNLELFCMINNVRIGKKLGASIHISAGLSALQELLEIDPEKAQQLITTAAGKRASNPLQKKK
jgi:hypothetical protein